MTYLQFRMTEYSAVTDGSGIAAFTFAPAYAQIIAIVVRPNWTGTKMVGGGEVSGARTLSGTQVQGMVSRGTLLLSAGPFIAAGSGETVTIEVLGR